ncbi:MAG: S9 family peptidase [Anaerolineales bacterium]
MPPYPTPPKRPVKLTAHGETRVDEYFWMRYLDDPAVMQYLKAENDYLDKVMQHTRPLEAQLFEEMKGRIKEDDSSVPARRGDYWYYKRMAAGQQYPVFCRRKGQDGPEEVLLDQNALAEGQPFCAVTNFTVSPDHNLLAYAVDFDGSETYTLYVKDLRTGALLPDQVPGTYYGLAWAEDNRTLFYVTLDAAHRPYKVWRHTLGQPPADDVLVLHEPDEMFFVNLDKTRSGRYIYAIMHSTETGEVWVMDAHAPKNGFRLLLARRQGVEYRALEHHGDRFLVVTNDAAENFRLVALPVDAAGWEHFTDVVPHRADVLVEGVEAFANFLVLRERQGGLRQLRLSAPDGVSQVRTIPMPEAVYNILPEDNPEFETDLFRFRYTSLVTPMSVIDYDTAADRWILRKQDEIPSGYDASQFVTERIHATAPDGTRVPMSLVYKKGLAKDGSNPTLLYGYGSYGFSTEPNFNATRLSLLERGVIFAIGHIRGGSEMGRRWYLDGKMMNKRNTFTDFIACAETLIAEGYTRPDKLAIAGRSAGGLLVGACMTMRPDLFRVVIADVPFVDVLTTMSDASIPLTAIEWEQWGNPANPDEYAYMRTYSPYDNIRDTAYPDVLLTTGLNDPRVAFWEPAKFAARLRDHKTTDSLVLLKTNFNAGHGGASGRYDFLKEVAFQYAFLLDRLGVA